MKEINWTPPTKLCPHPEYWNAVDEDSTELEVSELVAAFIRALQPEVVIETGTAFGQTSYAIGKALKNNGHGRLTSLEINLSRVQFSRQRCDSVPVDIINMASLDYVPTHPIDFIWFDSLIELRHQEFLHFKQWFSKRIIVGFHDTCDRHKTRALLTQHLIEPGFIRPIFLPTPRGVCFAEVLK